MPDNFQQTVDLKARAEAERQAMLRRGQSAPAPEPKAAPKPEESAPEEPAMPKLRKTIKRREKKEIKSRFSRASRASDIDQVFNDNSGDDRNKADLHRIERPASRPSYEELYKRLAIALAVVLVGLASFWFFSSRSGEPPAAPATDSTARWYAVKLTDDEIYYGQIADTGADPVEIRNVYYNYDQLSSGTDSGQTQDVASGAGNLRLVKRGNETYGPEGTMEVVRSQIVYMEPLKEDSKVLKAILDHEK